MNNFDRYRIENAIWILKNYEDTLRDKEQKINRSDDEMDILFDVLDSIECLFLGD